MPARKPVKMPRVAPMVVRWAGVQSCDGLELGMVDGVLAVRRSIEVGRANRPPSRQKRLNDE